MATNKDDTLVTMLKTDRDILKNLAEKRGRTMKYVLGEMVEREQVRVKELEKAGVPVKQH